MFKCAFFFVIHLSCIIIICNALSVISQNLLMMGTHNMNILLGLKKMCNCYPENLSLLLNNELLIYEL